jgi:hypothetical protein
MPATTTTICAFCHVAVEAGDATACGVCGTRHHVDCWEQNEGCAVALCAGGPELPFIPGGGATSNDGGRLLIDFGPEGRPQASRRGTYVGLGLAALVVVIGLIALIAHGSSTPSPAAGADAAVQDVAPVTAVAGVRPLRRTTAETITAQKQLVKRRAKRAAGTQRAHIVAVKRAQAEVAARRAQQSTPAVGATPNVASNTPSSPPPSRSPNSGARNRGGGTEKADPLVDNSFDN